jgi:hypothetical protein
LKFEQHLHKDFEFPSKQKKMSGKKPFSPRHLVTKNEFSVTVAFHFFTVAVIKATIMEVQRLSCVAPAGLEHRALRDNRLHGYFIPKGPVISFDTGLRVRIQKPVVGKLCTTEKQKSRFVYYIAKRFCC